MSSQIIIIAFDGQWVLGQRLEDKLPVERYVELLGRELGPQAAFKVVKSNLTECHLQFGEGVDTAPVLETLSNLVQREFKIDTNKFTLTVTRAEPQEAGPQAAEGALNQEKPAGKPGDSKQPVPAGQAEDDKIQKVLQKVDALAGAGEFGELCHELARMRPLLLKPGHLRAFLSQRYLFSVNEGCGFEKSVDLFAELLDALGLFEFSSSKKRARFLNFRQPEDMNDLKAQFSAVRDLYDKGSSLSAVIAIDISGWVMQHINTEFTGLLRQIAELPGQFITVFRLPYVEEHVLCAVYEVMSDVMNMRKIIFPPQSREEHWQYAKAALERCGFSLEGDMEPLFYSLLAREQQDGRFYGNDTVDKIVDQVLYRKLARVSVGLEPPDRLSAKDMETEQAQVVSRSAHLMLEELIGMEEVKKQLLQVVAQIEAGRELFGEGSRPPCVHMRFTGNPGTGKTTVARILGQMLKEKGVLSVGRFYEVTRADLCGRYVGETAPKTARVCRDALGSVLFIDEAYSLSAYGNDRVDYGQEAIDTLVSFMENHRDQLVVIMAGYKDEMDEMLLRNAGLASRMPYEILFPNYTREELFSIFLSGIHKEFSYNKEFEQAVRDYFNSITEEEYAKKTFGNGRLVRNLYERIWGKAVMRRRIDTKAPLTLLREDAELAISDREFKALVSKNPNPRRIGFLDK